MKRKVINFTNPMIFHRSKLFFFLILFPWLFINSCTVVTDAEQKLERLQSSVNAVETRVQYNLEYIETVRAIAMEVDQSGIGQTAQAVLTQLSDSGLIKTAQFVVSSEGPDLLKTVQNFVSEPMMKVQGTAEAITTRIPVFSDIPILSAEKEHFSSNGTVMSFSTRKGILEVVEFYESEMPEFGWVQLDPISTVKPDRALLHFSKSEHLAILSINYNKNSATTIVQISVQER